MISDSRIMLYLIDLPKFPSRKMNSFSSKLLYGPMKPSDARAGPKRETLACGLPFIPQNPRFFTGPVAFLVGLALVGLFLALGQPDIQLGDALVVEIDLQGIKEAK